MSHLKQQNSPAGSAPHLSAQQITQIQNQMIAELRRAVDDVDLRKSSVDAAVKVVEACKDQGHDVVALARSMYAFMAEPVARIEIDVKIT